MTRRKQNYPKRLKCSPSEGGSSQGREDSGEENTSPVATDDEEEDEEEDTPGDEDTTAATTSTTTSSQSHVLGDDDISSSAQCDGGESSRDLPKICDDRDDVSPNPQSAVKLSESHHNHTSPGPNLTPSPTRSTDPLASLSTMTVLAAFEDAKSKDTVIGATGKTSVAKPATDTSDPPSLPKNHNEAKSSPIRMASVIVPMAALSRRSLASSPDAEKTKMVDRASPLPLNFSRHHQAQPHHNAKAAATSAGLSRESMREFADDQPLDLSKKSNRPRSVSEPDPPPSSRRNGGGFGAKGEEGLSNGISSLQSLQKRFGGDFLMEPPRRPSSIIPLQSTILPSKSILRPPPILSNGLSHLRSPTAAASHHHPHLQQPHHHHHGLTTTKGKPTSTKAERLDKLLSLAMSSNSNSTNATSAPTTTNTPTTTSTTITKKSGSSEPPKKVDSAKVKVGSGAGRESSSSGGGGGGGGNSSDRESKYTIHRCSCQKSFGSLFALSAHLQETGHMPGSSKQASLMDYPKLVRGQDMWLNQESEQTRRILRCMQCGESFKSLPMLTVHMMQTQHYSKIVSADHGRRSHKCSAYCDRELDRECIFKCKVCQETFTDMEGLANHMIVSGHHKKQVLRSHNYPEMGFRHKQRKRFLSDDAHGSTVASLLEYKRKFPDGSGGGSNGYLSQLGQPGVSGSGSSSDSSITCESCGKKIEMTRFVEHVRACLRQKAEVIDALKNKLTSEEAAPSGKHSESGSLASKTPKTSSSDSGELPLPSTKDSALFKRLELRDNSLRCSPPGVRDGDKPKIEKRECDEDNGDVGGDSDTVVKKVKRESAEDGADDRKEKGDDENKTQDSVGDADCSKSAEESSVNDAVKVRKNTDSDIDQTQASSCPKDEKVGDSVDNTLAGNASPPLLPVRFKLEPKDTDNAPQSKDLERKYPPKIPSPMTDEDNTSERTPSPPGASGLSQSGDSKPPSPCTSPTPSLSPAQQSSPSRPSPLPPREGTKRPEKRERKDDGGSDPDSVVNKKKIKLEEDVDRERDRLTPSVMSQPMTSPCSSGDASKKDGDVQERDKSLDIIDPNSMDEPAGAEGRGSSALKAMESFIQRSFSSKFDSRRNSSLSSAFAGMMGTSHVPPLMGLNRVVSSTSPSHSATSSTPSSSSMSYLAKFSRFFSPIQPTSSKYLDAGFDVPLPSYERNVLSSLSARSAEILEKSKSQIRDPLRSSPASVNGPLSGKPSTQTSDKAASESKKSKNKDVGSGDEGEELEDGESDEKKEDLANKYLNPDEESDEEKSTHDGEEGSKGKAGGSGLCGKQSALDSLSSFVYGQPMTSEHPLDSLQKLLTKTSIPKMMGVAAGAHLHFNPLHHHYFPEQMMERMCYTPPDLPSSSSASAMPLNLSLKPGGGVSGSDDDDDNPDVPPDCGSPSLSHDGEDDDHSSPGGGGIEGEMTEYKCAACSRRFASKGSYRYHLSRCHLSSVKKYGIKEAFNMSPYVYLPLDHTAKFTKYYQMAQELASKGK